MNWFTKKIMGLFGNNTKSAEAIVQVPDGHVAVEAPDYSSMKVAELKAIAKERGVKGYYKLKKADLISALSNQ